jgi:hypothetical protein
LLLAGGQIVVWLWEGLNKPKEAPDAVAAVMGGENPFAALVKNHPKVVEARMGDVKPRRVVFPAVASNLQFGDPTSEIIVTILSDPSCGTCRKQVRAWLQMLPRDVRVVSKFWPQNPLRLTPGMLVELARREGVAATFLGELENTDGDLDDAMLLTLLEKAGVPLARQREALSDGSLGSALQNDLAKGRELQLPPAPLMLINGYVMDGVALTPDKAPEYVARLREHKPLAQDSDYFLMEK